MFEVQIPRAHVLGLPRRGYTMPQMLQAGASAFGLLQGEAQVLPVQQNWTLKGRLFYLHDPLDFSLSFSPILFPRISLLFGF